MTTPVPPRSWGEAIRSRREAAGLNQQTLAHMVKVHASTISRIERGEHGASDELRLRIAAALSTTVAELFAYPDSANAA